MNILAAIGAWTLLACWPLVARAQPSAIFVPLPPDFSASTIDRAVGFQFSLLKNGSRNTIIAWGPIKAGDDQRLRFALAEGKPVQEIQLFSPGGSLGAGINMGRIIRAARLSTRVVAGARCYSACNFAFMGGVVRVVEPGGNFGVHMFSNDSAERLLTDIYNPPRTVEEFNDRYPTIRSKSYKVAEDLKIINGLPKAVSSPVAGPGEGPGPRPNVNTGPRPEDAVVINRYLHNPTVMESVIGSRVSEIQMTAAETAAYIAEYLVEMRMPLRFLTTFAGQPAADMKILTQDELRDLNIVN